MSRHPHRRHQLFTAIILTLMASQIPASAQAGCPVSLVSAEARNDSIQVEFRNKSKQPIEQLSFACTPPPRGTLPNGACHVETGIFYPGAVGWVKIPYAGASRHSIQISVTQLRMAGGTIWQPGPSTLCKPRRTTGS